MIRTFPRAAIALVGLAAAACESYGADDFAVGAACGAREERCRQECDRAFEIQQNSWDYARCTEQCEQTRGDACRPRR
ncbi:MAG: hypothetical protein AAGC56_12035 [Pseudomonadota bacterium]